MEFQCFYKRKYFAVNNKEFFVFYFKMRNIHNMSYTEMFVQYSKFLKKSYSEAMHVSVLKNFFLVHHITKQN